MRQVASALIPQNLAEGAYKAGYVPGKNICFVVTANPEDEAVTQLKKMLDATIISGPPKSDFNFIRSFNKIVCGNSTFSWWATFLSEANTIITYKPWLRFHDINLWQLDGALTLDSHFI
jgi:hypothetical protein